MKLTCEGLNYTFERDNGETVSMTWQEIRFIEEELEKNHILGEIYDAIATLVDDGVIDASLTDNDDLAKEAMQTISDKMNIYPDYNPDWYEILDVVQETAKDF